MIKIAPSILAADFSRLGEEIGMVEKAGADYIHVDVMDGNFVPNISIGQPVVSAVRKITHLPLDVHLMINDPDRYIEEFAEAGADIICIHQEACLHLDRSIGQIKALGKKAAVSLNPATNINTLKYVLDKLDMVLLMSVNPGFGGQEFIESSTGKITELRKMADELNPGLDIEVDGGITLENVERIIKAGANVIVAGSSIYKAQDPAYVISRMRELAEK
ncbi:MAG: ribulose-phosphate 3-epimerase [Clostridia bacterium]|nr:ribulose-phosphate 3-epimerase [Clostridia bacterium]MBN2883400.1 ribulose-phosphate 3-epimerase [Clostridia bacterium]